MTTLQFDSNDVPQLPDGRYDITLQQTLTLPGEQPKNYTGIAQLYVSGERFTLPGTLIGAVFPPDNSTGDYSNTMPHIQLNRSTLPWEREPADDITPADGIPWLLLLVFDDSEYASGTDFKTMPDGSQAFTQSMTLGDLQTSPYLPPITLEIDQSTDEVVQVLTVKNALLEQILPGWSEIPTLAHVRQTHDDGTVNEDSVCATIVANRLPRSKKRTIVHLVSVENRYEKSGNSYEFNYTDADQTQFVSLAGWSFTCADESQSFPQLMSILADNATMLQAENPDNSLSGTADDYRKQGYVPLPHQLREGHRTYSWYRGPFVPGDSAIDETHSRLPAITSDDLLHYNPVTGLFDTSLAAAWQLGRLWMLNSVQTARTLYSWKQTHIKTAVMQPRLQARGLHFRAESAPELPETLVNWFNRLANFDGLPFNYLVPDESLLPLESLRFFQIDPGWQRALLDGAYSIGRITAADRDRDAQRPVWSYLDDMPVAGVLIRSQVVSGFPGLIVESRSDSGTLEPVRMERLSPYVLLCLFDTPIDKLAIRLQPQTLHFAFDYNNGAYVKPLRNEADGSISDDTVTVTFRSDDKRVLNIDALVNEILSCSNNFEGVFTSADFAYEMIESQQVFVFNP